MNNTNLKAWLKRQKINFEMYEDNCFILVDYDIQVYNDIECWTIDYEGTEHHDNNRDMYKALKSLIVEVTR